ncbi:Fur family transcriptional regulator [Pleionea sediminis]|uniref:Fur family transcriptional regulator n=1 Tax=Pleionea sediminis TaxID=2569479 RepID=UPI0011866B1B|nr:transcriptional repressor [Pleionea sediminis]
MSKLQTVIDHAEEHCKANGSRLTNKRKQVLSSLIKSQKALSAYDIVNLCREDFGESILAMSVYRILDFLESEHLVHKLNIANKYVACSHITCDHDHGVPQFLICKECDKVKEISVSKSTLNELKASVEKAEFHLVTPQLEMNCICSNCHSNNIH